MTPAITTLIPTYRRPHLLRRAILSALNQTYTNLQVCVYDNASGDDTAAVVAELAQSDSRLRYVCHPQNIGMAANFNYGFARINTPYFSLLCDDDLLLPEFYASAMRDLAAHPQAKFAGGTVLGLFEDTQEVIDIPGLAYDGLISPPLGLQECVLGRHPLVTGVLYSKAVMDNVGLWETDIITADIHFQMRATARYPFVISKKPYAVVVTHRSNATNQVRDNHAFAAMHARQVKLVQTELGLSKAAQTQVIRLMNTRAKSVLWRAGLVSLSNADAANVRQVAALLAEQLGENKRASLLRLSASLAEKLGANSLPFQVLRKAHRRFRQQKHRAEQRFQPEMDYIQRLNQLAQGRA